jgi:deoxyribose-phosphate aldolase
MSSKEKTVTAVSGELTSEAMAAMIDHTLLKADATPKQIIQLCAEARQYHFWSVCINPVNVKLCATQLKGSNVKVCSVVCFPLGAVTSESKAAETQKAIDDGASEIDMVINIGALKAGDKALVESDIHSVVTVAHKAHALVKVIIETCLLTDEEKVLACQLAKKAGADFVKTSTGFSTAGATVHDVQLMRQTVGPEMGVKAAGGIHSREDAEALIKAGATRIGASASIKIIGAA